MERRQATETGGDQTTCLETICEDQRQAISRMIADLEAQLDHHGRGISECLRSATSSDHASGNPEHIAVEQRVRELRAVLATTQSLTDLGEAVISLVHEGNQPLTAIGLYAAGCRHLVALGRYEELDAVLMKIADESERACQVAHQIRGLVGASKSSAIRQ